MFAVYFLIGFILLVFIASRFFFYLYRNELRPTATYYVETADGWQLALHYYKPAPNSKKKTPVICCHGLAGNHHSFDLTERTSIARAIARAGHPTYALDMRGAVGSEKGGLFQRKPLHWRFSDHYKYDAPAAIDKVCELTGAKKIHWVGHSMGGMVAYALMQGPYAEKINRCVILSSPTTFTIMRPMHKYAAVLKVIPSVPLRTLTQAIAHMMEWFKPWQFVSGNENLALGDFALSSANCQSQMPNSLLLDFARFIEHGHFLDDEGNSLLEGLAKVKTPTLVMVGEKDAFGYKSVKAGYDYLGSKEKKFVTLGVNHGQQREYAHMTILVGRDVAEEVFPELLAWLAKG